ncbi:putative ubiquitin-conjugating enzyme E2 38 isoform X2 [Durio zibethinus]|uniref:E2 ubiquitin-conjugating enzyme n=1 Tax=Durio zibethinus TaxID=66656 RepID=A0A6P5YD97_DURZI|nr:putative ubiquitin-conjugating enzyme E2 38 isoform X2 [Durio zibethinus]
MDLRVDGTSISKRLKPTQILLCDAMDIEQVEDLTTVLIDSEKTGMDSKGKTNTELLYHDDDGDSEDYADYVSDYGDNDDFPYEDDCSIVQSHFDNVDLPPGIEASIPWLKGPATIGNVPPAPGASSAPCLDESKKETTLNLADGGVKSASTSTSMFPIPSGSYQKEEGNEEHGVMQKFQSFKNFGVVDDFSDHHYSNLTSAGEKQPKEWVKRIQDEWKILENLPEIIYVRVCEARMGLLRAVIIGPSGTPYHDGLFVFDCFFPPKYPYEPPMVYYYSGGLRLNPNLYNCGKVCLSLLGTWQGQPTERWVPGQSTMLQVLVSLQALILNARPFFNEPGYETLYVGAEGDRGSREYNEEVFILSLKTMIYTLRRPPEHFEDFVAGHFRNRARDIIVACKAYREGATVGSVVVKDGVPDANKMEKGSSGEFKRKLLKMINAVIKEFVKNGSTDCEQFQFQTS